ncbi:DUF4440 domain-containing protein [Cyanobium sp. WAJ14-Wanaka]|uniref:DUF4440 domain-containing protein n=1 Tax=Cyanobium sp. WAJ14-Wanaka TaxID=2823725 RepID=UPI0020CD300B|nr:DUF4440 domain-containing protein [Cyanobium sp. WAJ14-Wanaka]MCP9773972.1 nuclear transport factor 2 family protein [Cyanobium sp. WAJ14-Wanaka]
MNQSVRDQEIIAINQAMLNSVVKGDWSSYASYCSEDLSCFEAETNGIIVEGLPFHRFYFPENSAQTAASVNVTMAGCHLRWLGDDAVVLSYTRLTQRMVEASAITASCCETRIWQKQSGNWKQVHVHRS